jgi:pyruvate/2-oxoglutarate/acetoin dehydrogenase E1 component
MERDESVFLLGEDIGLGGGAFYITKGFQERFGRERVVDMPLSEAGFTGAAIGAALNGMRPIVEFQFADFVTESFKMIVDFAGANSTSSPFGFTHQRWPVPQPESRTLVFQHTGSQDRRSDNCL